MRFQRINLSDGDKIFMRGINVSTETLSKGYAVCLDTATAGSFGARMTKPATANLMMFVGLNSETNSVQVNDSFDVQVYGGCTYARIIQDTTAAGSVASGGVLIPSNADWNLIRSGQTAVGAVGLVVAATAVATATNTSAITAQAVWLRAMALLASAGLALSAVA